MAQLGKYDILEELGRGGFGIVYKARDISLNRLVALKVLHPQLTVDPKFIENFKSEAQKLAQVEHPNVVSVHEINEVEGKLFIVMRYLPGGNLGDRIAAGSLDIEEALRILGEAAKGLAAGHEKGIIHRDVKPANIIFDETGRAVVTDFGVAKAVHLSTIGTTSVSSGMVGTPYYRPPELWRGKPKPSPATDVYSLGCVLYEMLTGEVLFTGETPDQVMTCHVLEGAKDLLKSSPGAVPQTIQPVLEKALSKDPSQRYQSTDVFMKALKQKQDTQSVALKAAPQKAPDQVDPTRFPKRPSQRSDERHVSKPVWKEDRVESEKVASTGVKKEGIPKWLIWGAIGLVAVVLIVIWISNLGGSNSTTEKALVSVQLAEEEPKAIEVPKDEPQEEPTETTEAVEETEEPTRTATTKPQPDVTFEGISFSFDSEICSGFTTEVSKYNTGVYYDTPLDFFSFNFNNYAIRRDRFFLEHIVVFSMEEYSKIDEYFELDEINKLKETLNKKLKSSDLGFIPFKNAGIFFNAKVSYFDFKNGSGMRFLGIGGQDFDTVDNTTLFYTYYGITNDNRYIISAIFPVTHRGLPDEQSEEIMDWLFEDSDNWQEYLSDSVGWLESQENDSFYPNLEKLDEMMASFEINR